MSTNIAISSKYTSSEKTSCDVIEKKILELSKKNPSYGYWKLYYLLRDDGYLVNHKRVYRIYTLLGLTKNKNKIINKIKDITISDYYL